MPDVNIIVGENWRHDDKSLLFAPNDHTPPEVIHFFPATLRMPQLLKEVLIFSSTSQARKAGWDKPIPPGWSDFTIGKKRTRICIWNPE
jgi:hypothetical protein